MLSLTLEEQFLIVIIKLVEKQMIIGLALEVTPLMDVNHYIHLYLCKN